MKSRYISRRSWMHLSAIQGIAALSVGIQPTALAMSPNRKAEKGLLRLNSNENQFGPSQAVTDAIQQLSSLSNFYSWTGRQALREKIAVKEGHSPDHILIGAGSTELLQLAGITFASDHQKFISSYPTFPILMQQGEKFKANWIKVSLDDTHRHDLSALRKTAADDPALIYLCNPNNPTGSKMTSNQIAEFASSLKKDQILFLDEAYLEFSDPNLMSSGRSLVQKLQNVVVARTFSKIYGMAGLRVGYVCAHPSLISRLKKYQVGFGIDISSISLAAASAALDDTDFIHHCKASHEAEKQKVYGAFDRWLVEYIPSATSFIYFNTGRFKPNLVKHLEDNQILIRNYNDQPGFARVSVGTSHQMDIFIGACEQHLS